MARFRYLSRCLARQFNPPRFHCPNCGHSHSEIIDRKYFVSQLQRCNQCKLMFRTPTDDPTKNQQFYEKEYRQGFTTDLPSDSELQSLKLTNFTGTEKDYAAYIQVLRRLGLGHDARIFDFGCSWGYGSYQLMQAGFNVASFEIDRTRRRFARDKLGVRCVDDMDSLASDQNHIGRYDCFFSAHVLEHVHRPKTVFEYARKLLAANGLFVSFTPNGSAAFRQREPVAWSLAWGEVHPNFIDDVFLDLEFRHSPRTIGSSPVTVAALPATATALVLDSLERSELMFAALPNCALENTRDLT
jgi:2-polyprenyl-3-methyl-5-hydroxy-6-metoxy-1,4-benzoquinol methylase